MTKYLINMHKKRYKFTKKRNKCDVIIKSTITKSWDNDERLNKVKPAKTKQ